MASGYIKNFHLEVKEEYDKKRIVNIFSLGITEYCPQNKLYSEAFQSKNINRLSWYITKKLSPEDIEFLLNSFRFIRVNYFRVFSNCKFDTIMKDQLLLFLSNLRSIKYFFRNFSCKNLEAVKLLSCFSKTEGIEYLDLKNTVHNENPLMLTKYVKKKGLSLVSFQDNITPGIYPFLKYSSLIQCCPKLVKLELSDYDSLSGNYYSLFSCLTQESFGSMLIEFELWWKSTEYNSVEKVYTLSKLLLVFKKTIKLRICFQHLYVNVFSLPFRNILFNKENFSAETNFYFDAIESSKLTQKLIYVANLSNDKFSQYNFSLDAK
eukprot:snap_masked-scaffold_87-processed-gene-0.24-mRNA-1 protein AED:1.00 eAED:1.00 QI:0/0/0/0/1/1/2/0/320